MDKRLENCIVLEMDKSISSLIIAWATKLFRKLFYRNQPHNITDKDFSHLYFRLLNGYGFESTFPKVRVMTPKIIAKRETNKNTYLLFIKLKKWKEDKLIKAYLELVSEEVGHRYPLMQLVGAFYVLIYFMLRFKKVRNPFGQNKVCSEEWFALSKKESKYAKLFEECDPDIFSPLDFYNYVIENPDYFEIVAQKNWGEDVATYSTK